MAVSRKYRQLLKRNFKFYNKKNGDRTDKSRIKINNIHRIGHKVESPFDQKPFDRMSNIDTKRKIGRQFHRKPFDRMTFDLIITIQ
jgi:PIN domain nuclease of toxin-antitoxin system